MFYCIYTIIVFFDIILLWKKLIEKCRGLKIGYIAEQTKIPREIISAFKNNRRELWEESLIKLNNFLDKY